MHRFLSAVIIFVFCLGGYCTANAEESRLLRYPDIYGEQIAFVFADRVWVSTTSGGAPHALTEAAVGTSRPHFSPDGSNIAYTANVDGNFDVYVVPVTGGIPHRLTHHPAQDMVLGWHPLGHSVLFASTMSSPRAVYKQLFTVSIEGGLPEKLPVPYGESATFSEDGSKLFFSYHRDFQEESWKRYYGGRAPDIWSYTLANGVTEKLTTHPASDSVPMRINNQTYFLSERAESGRDNIWRRDSSGNVTQVTHYTETDVRRPSTDGQNIIFEAAGRLYILNPVTNALRPVRIDIALERKNWLPHQVNVAPRITNASLANDGRVMLEARGDVFIYDVNTDIVKNLTPSSASAERFPQLSKDGKLAYISDRSGEYQVYTQSLEGEGAATRLTNFGAGLQYNPFWSPDGTKVAFIDYEQVIWILDTQSGVKTRVDQGMWRFADGLSGVKLKWSPDSRLLTYARGLKNRNKAIFVYDVAAKIRHQLTSGAFSDFSPSFDPSGNYILMLSNRNFSPTFGDENIDATWTYADSVTVNILSLRREVKTPDSVGWEAPERRTHIEIDFNDIEGRLATLNADAGEIKALAVINNGYVVSRGGEDSRIERYEYGKSEPSTLQTGDHLSLIDDHDGQLLTRDGDKWFVLGNSQDSKPKRLKTDRLTSRVDAQAEYKQMFEDAWRFARDFYYDPGLHGVNWQEEHERYGALVEHAYVDSDMTYILSELMGELEGGHVYALGSAPGPRGDATNVGLLGIDFKESGTAYKIEKIYNSGNRRYEFRSPLDDASLNVVEGNYILSVNGIQLTTDVNPWATFEGLAEQIVELKIADTAEGTNPRTIKVKTLSSERKLRELAWVDENRRKVEAASSGRIGYIYVPNTSEEGINELMIQYQYQFHKDALIIDERFNTGGALGDRLVELLNRPPLVWFRARNSTSYSLPELAHRGPKALLINGWSYSGGDGFPLLFKTAKVGPLIGTRTWGGLIGPGMFMPLANGGFVSVPPIRVAGNDGQWSEGNEGVKPNIEIANDPGKLAKGIDQQLDRAITEMMQTLMNYEPVPVPEFQKAGEWNPVTRGEK